MYRTYTRKRLRFLALNDATAAGVVIAVALVCCIDPAGQSVCNITRIAVSSKAILKIASAENRARIVNTSSSVISRNIISARFVDAVGKAVAIVGTSSTLADHLINSSRGARVLDKVVVIASGSTVMVLHKARVSNSKVGGVDTDTAVRLLHNNSQDKTMVDTSGGRSHLNAIPDSTL